MKKLIVTTMVASVTLSSTVFANEINSNANQSYINANYEEIQGNLNWNDTAQFTTTNWSNIAGMTPIISTSRTVRNHGNNSGAVRFRAVNGSGNVIATSGNIQPNGTWNVNLPSNQGHITIQGQAVSISGAYGISIQ